MAETLENELRGCAPRQTQPATFEQASATIDATTTQPSTLKSAALQVLMRNTDATSAAPGRNSGATLSYADEKMIRVWLDYINEIDQAIIEDVLTECRANAEARRYFLARAEEKPLSMAEDDNRRTCTQCANLIGRRCQAAKRGEIGTSRNYEPIRDLPQRCEGYAPGADDPDRRYGLERWPRQS